jgi:hypothetical protein
VSNYRIYYFGQRCCWGYSQNIPGLGFPGITLGFENKQGFLKTWESQKSKTKTPVLK